MTALESKARSLRLPMIATPENLEAIADICKEYDTLRSKYAADKN